MAWQDETTLVLCWAHRHSTAQRVHSTACALRVRATLIVQRSARLGAARLGRLGFSATRSAADCVLSRTLPHGHCIALRCVGKPPGALPSAGGRRDRLGREVVQRIRPDQARARRCTKGYSLGTPLPLVHGGLLGQGSGRKVRFLSQHLLREGRGGASGLGRRDRRR